MMHSLKRFITLAAAAALLAYGSGTSFASLLKLDMSGKTGSDTTLDGSTTLNGNTINNGQSWSLSATFDTATLVNMGGNGFKAAPGVSVTGVIDGTSFTTTGSFDVWLFDTLYLPPNYAVGFYIGNFNSIVTLFGSTAPAGWSADAPTPTIFQNDKGFLGPAYSSMNFSTSAGYLNLAPTALDTTAQITGAAAVPEPSTFVLLAVSFGVLGYARKKMIKADVEQL